LELKYGIFCRIQSAFFVNLLESESSIKFQNRNQKRTLVWTVILTTLHWFLKFEKFGVEHDIRKTVRVGLVGVELEKKRLHPSLLGVIVFESGVKFFW